MPRLRPPSFFFTCTALALFHVLLPFCFIHADDAKIPTIQLNRKLKSVLYPGWGQLSRGERFKGVAFATAETACIGLAYYYNHAGNRDYSSYKAADTTEKVIHFRRRVERFDRNRNICIAVGALIWIVNIFDMYYSGPTSTHAMDSYSRADHSPGGDPARLHGADPGIMVHWSFRM